jgi:hypothetical protein
MSNWKTFLFFTLVGLAVLIQVVVLRWGMEAVFFATWFLLMLGVKHDTRLSPALGLVFLAACPFLLIADKEPAAEQAANYAYFFLAIGVLVQVEEMILERNNRLGWKADISYLWQPVVDQMGAFPGLIPSSTGTSPSKSISARWISIIGIGGLVVIYFVAAFSGVQPSLLTPLMGVSILFLFFVWGLRLVLLAIGQAKLSQAAWTLLLLPLLMMAGIWINDLIGAYRLANMEVAYYFVEQLNNAERSLPPPEGEMVEAQAWTIGNESQQVLFQHPALAGASRISFPLHIEPGARLAFDTATAPDSWERPGDGASFTIIVNSGNGPQQVFSTYIDPKKDEFDRRWHSYTVDLNEFSGQDVLIIFETGSGPAGDYRYDWAGWGEPRLLVP